ncbi:MAG: zinc-dependent metalloprotease [Polyangiales bacterium]
MRMRPLFALALGLLAAACGDRQPPVNRVQPNVVEKALFNDGSAWYFLQTVIDSPYSASYTFVGEQGDTEKVVWEIQEDYLIARRAYQHIAGSDGAGISGANLTGAAVAMYKISSHFDIRREYNPVTGEEQNVISENSSDRPWYEREFMRVDWSENLITNNDFLVAAKLFDGIQAESVAYFIPPGTGHPHEPKFVETTEGEGVSYIDIVNKMFVRPTVAHIEGFGDIPTCYLNGSSHLDCAPGEITIRNSFLRVDPSRDYEPMEYTGDRMERFGYFISERAGYDDEYGPVESARLRFVNRHNLWQTSHRRDEAGGLIRCTEATADLICGGNGSRCDLAYGMARREQVDGQWAGACTIPYRERQVRPIAYHLSSNFPEDLLSDAQSVADDWNEVFVGAVSSMRETECLQAGGDAGTCAAERSREDHQQMFVLCHNPVLDTDHAACGGAGTSAQIGDLRYSMLGWVNDPHASSPLGYGPSSADPETGEIVMGNAFIYGAGLETLQSFARDILGLLTGDISESQITSGEVVEAWVERNSEPGARTSLTGVDGTMENPSEGMDFSWVERFRAADRAAPTTVGELVSRVQEARQNLRRAGAFGNGSDVGNARLQNLVGTDIERLLATPEMRIAAGVDPSAQVDDSVLEQASPLRGFGLRAQEAMQRAHDRLHELGQCRIHAAEFSDEGMLGLARAIQRAVDSGDGTIEWYGNSYQLREADGSIDYRAVRDMVRHPIFHGVTAHELGHTVGLRHNFSGSYDAMNYAPDFWRIRDDGTMAPRAWDPLTDAEIDARIKEYQYSTVMDYGHNFVVTDANGLGHYDHAAIKMGYGDLVEVFATTPAANQRELAWFTFFQANWPVPLKISAFEGGEVSAYNYTDIPSIVGGREVLEQRVDVPYTSLRAFPELASNGIADPMMDAEGRLAVPYLFCSDEQADLGPDCYRYDAGSDPYETVNSVIESYWNYYIFNAFRRGRLGFDTGPYADRIYGRYFEKLKYANQIYSLYRPIFVDIFGEAQAETFFNRQDGLGPYTLAVQSAFRLLTRVITTPEPGTYVRRLRGDGTEGLVAGGGGLGAGVGVDAFDGRALETTWNFDDGYFWFDQLERVGFFYDKVLAVMALTDPQSNFLGRDTSADVRQYQINFYSSFSPAMQGFFRGLWGDDWSVIAPRSMGNELVYPSPAQLAGATMPGTPLEPNASFSIQLYSAVYAMAWIPETFDRSFFQRSRIWVRGGADEVTPDAALTTVEFTDERTGLTYVAISYPEGGEERGPAAQMLLHAQALADNGALGELDAYIDNLDVMRRLGWSYDLGR